MSKEKRIEQIKELAEFIYFNSPCTCLDEEEVLQVAGALYKAGYRKRSDVVGEILQDMEKRAFTMHDDDSGEFILCMYCEDFEEIKEKCGEGDETTGAI